MARMNRAAWNPLGSGPRNPSRIRALGTQEPFARTGVEENQGLLYPDDIARDLEVPQPPGLTEEGYQNPYSMTMFTFPVANGATGGVAQIVVPANARRTYLILQNQGPGNIFINFGQSVTVATSAANSNGMTLIPTQIYEQIGGGYYDPGTGFSIPFAFVSGDYISVLADQDVTTILVGEGVYTNIKAFGSGA